MRGHESTVLVLLQNQADPNLQTKVTSRRMMIMMIVDGDDVNNFLQDGETPLHSACEKGHESTVLVLLQNQADPNLQNKVTSRRMIDDESRQ